MASSPFEKTRAYSTFKSAFRKAVTRTVASMWPGPQHIALTAARRRSTKRRCPVILDFGHTCLSAFAAHPAHHTEVA